MFFSFIVMNKILIIIILISIISSQILCIRYKTYSSSKSRDYIRLKKLNKSLIFVPKLLKFGQNFIKQVFGWLEGALYSNDTYSYSCLTLSGVMSLEYENVVSEDELREVVDSFDGLESGGRVSRPQQVRSQHYRQVFGIHFV